MAGVAAATSDRTIAKQQQGPFIQLLSQQNMRFESFRSDNHARFTQRSARVFRGAAMSVFICWSGDRSKAIAEALKPLLEGVFPSLAGDTTPSPIFLSKNIEKGAEWFQAIRAGLDSSQAGIVVLTHENARNPWIHCEAGALASTLAAEALPIAGVAAAALGSAVGVCGLADSARASRGLLAHQAIGERNQAAADRAATSPSAAVPATKMPDWLVRSCASWTAV